MIRKLYKENKIYKKQAKIKQKVNCKIYKFKKKIMKSNKNYKKINKKK